MSHIIMYFVRRVLEHYELYALFIPLFIFYFMYLKQVIIIGYHYKIEKHVMSFYYPINSESFLINIFIIYPQRAAFDVFYFNHNNGAVNILRFCLAFSITLLFGIPLFIIKTIILLMWTRSCYRTGNYLSKYDNKAIVTVDGIIICNMKNGLSSFIKENFNFTKNAENNINKCILKTYYGDSGKRYSYHGVAFDENTRLGVIYTTKEQEHGTCLRHLNGTYVYMQEVLNNNIISNIDNSEITQLLNISGTLDVLRSHYKITTSQGITTNQNSRQSLVQINQQMRNNAIQLINNYGGIDKLKKALDFQDNYELTINNAMKLLGDLENSTIIFKKILMNDNANIYKQLCDYKEISLDSEKMRVIDKLVKSFDKIYEEL